jgi:putative flippase GtrA
VTRQFALFAVVGGFAAAVNIVVRWLVNFIMPFEVAIVIAFAVALSAAFFLNRRVVFRATDGAGQQFQRFLIVNLLALGQVWLISVALARWAFPSMHFDWHAETVAHSIGVASPIVTSYFAHKHFSFA